MGRYEPLRDYLASRPGDEESMTFSQLERLVGPLPGGLFINRIFGFLCSETLAVGTTKSSPQFHRQR